MDFIGEHLVPGKLGHFFIVLSLVASLAATFAYGKSVVLADPLQKGQWKKLARIFFLAEAASVFIIFGILYYIVKQHLFEYKYAWQHSSNSLEPKYLLAAIWEGQEGSFLLWSIWHCVLGLVVMRKEKEWEAPVMTVLSFTQFLLATMVAGITLLGWKIGSNPYVLLRNELNAPIFSRPDYLSLVKDGNDLNPLLQNYWMVIHPPVLFLGFAATVIPFAFAVGGLWTRRFGDWIKPALPWTLFAVAVLGLGIMMGAAWAYESLTFGGYWAWDPVENASLVPWLVLVAGLHTMLIYRNTGHSLRATHLFVLLGFLLVLYSTYLTRSGDLQDTSVHAFTGEGITKWHLRIFLLLLAAPSLGLFISRYKKIPHIAKEEEASSREFWMFVGSLVLFLSALTISCMTSIPVFNKVAKLFVSNDKLFTPLAMGEDSEFAYNRIQVFVAVVIGLLSGFGMYLKYKATGKPFLKKILWPAVAALAVAGLILGFGKIDYNKHGIGYLGAVWLAIAASVYAVISNASYIWVGLNGRLRSAGGAVAHVGFGLMLVGILISSSKKDVLSHNTTGIFISFGEGSKEQAGENLTLIKGMRTDMGKYWVTYEKDSTHPKKPLWYYHIKFESKDGKENFTLTPNAFVNYKGNEGLMANPDARHYWNHDVFTYITSLPDPDKSKEDTSTFKKQTVAIGDTVFYSKGFAVLENIVSRDKIPQAGFALTDTASVATVKVFAKSESIYTIEPLLISRSGDLQSYPDSVTAENLVVQLEKVSGNKAELGIKESDAIMQYVTLKAYTFPFINVLWLGTLVMVFGTGMSMWWRIRTNRVSLRKL
ncbi:cytochrome c biogenesis protein CcsA [Paraflavisolibacter sp. H34]|uniref:cytochrome c biogenesis protein CcsA n=1 Tax=Huijunlia imazamoxiresistens TaxID=3127457 RepID=UPI003016B495